MTPRLRQSVSNFAASGLDSVDFDRYFEEVSTPNIFMTMIISGTLERKHNLERGRGGQSPKILYMYVDAHVCMCTDTQTYTNTHTHTHTHTHSSYFSFSLSFCVCALIETDV